MRRITGRASPATFKSHSCFPLVAVCVKTRGLRTQVSRSASIPPAPDLTVFDTSHSDCPCDLECDRANTTEIEITTMNVRPNDRALNLTVDSLLDDSRIL